MYCQVCGDTENLSYYPKLRMRLCKSCRTDYGNGTKASFEDFRKFTGIEILSLARDFYEDYQASKYFKVSDYWEACSSN